MSSVGIFYVGFVVYDLAGLWDWLVDLPVQRTERAGAELSFAERLLCDCRGNERKEQGRNCSSLRDCFVIAGVAKSFF